MNKYLEKIAADKEHFSKKQKTAAGGGAAVLGASVVNKQYHGGHITGRETLYHGTSAANKEQILKDGLKPRAKKGIIDIAQDATGQNLKSDNLTFMTRSKMQAHSYANQASRIENGTFNIHDMVGRLKDAIPGKESSKGVININAPTWKKDEFRKVRNPEVKTSFKTVNEDAFSPKFAKTQQKRTIYSTLEKEVFTNKGNVSNKYMEGSKAYQKNSLGEIREFAKANTKRFLKGTGKAAMGAAMIGGGLAYAANQFKKHGK